MTRYSAPTLVFVLAVLLAVCLVPQSLAISWTLLTGWVSYFGRVSGEVTIHWPSVATALICFVLLAIGMHLFCRWAYRHSPGADATLETPRVWKPRWTAALLGTVVLLFIAGVAAVGIVHQTAWLSRSSIEFTSELQVAETRTRSANKLKFMSFAV
jgi:hypothetical protein